MKNVLKEMLKCLAMTGTALFGAWAFEHVPHSILVAIACASFIAQAWELVAAEERRKHGTPMSAGIRPHEFTSEQNHPVLKESGMLGA